MALSFVDQATGTTSANLPAFNVGDLALVFAFRDGSTTAPSLPAGWTNVLSRGTTTSCSQRVGWRRLQSGDTTTGTWTNATSVVVVIYRSSTTAAYVGGSAANGGTTNTANFPAVTFKRTDGTSWAVGFIGHRSTNQNIETAPSGMTNRANVADATDEASGHDTNGGVTGWSSTNQTLTGTASGWQSSVIEIVEAVAGDVMQYLTATSASASSLGVTGSFKGGSLLVVHTGWDTSDATPTCADGGTNSYAAIGSHLWNSSGSVLYGSHAFYAFNITALAGTVTVSYGGTKASIAVQLAEMYWPNTSDPLDQQAGTLDDPSGSGADAISSGSIVPSVDNCLIMAGATDVFSSSPTVTAGTSFTLCGTNVNPDAASTVALESFVQGAAASQAGTFGTSADSSAGAKVWSFKPAASSESRTPPVGALALVGAAAAVIVNTIITPLAGALAAVGLSASLATAIPPPAGQLALAGSAPTVVQQSDTAITPPTGELWFGIIPPIEKTPPAAAAQFAGSPPTILVDLRLAPPSGSLSAQGASATTDLALRPTQGGLAVTGNAPARLDLGIGPPAGSVAAVANAPRLDTGVAPAAAALILAGDAPTLVGAGGISPPSGSLSLQGAAPVVVNPVLLTPPAGALTATGQAPTVLAGAAPIPGTGALALEGQAPTVLAPTTAEPGAGSLALAGAAAQVVQDRRLQPPAGALATAGLTPALRHENIVGPPAGALGLTGSIPAQALTAGPAAAALALAGSPPVIELGFPSVVAIEGFISPTRPVGFLTRAEPAGFDASTRPTGFVSQEVPS